MKLCRRCGTHKPLNEFSFDRHQFDGRQCYCKSCQSILYKERSAIRKQGRIPTLVRYSDEELINELKYRLSLENVLK